jgi:guanylate kinase
MSSNYAKQFVALAAPSGGGKSTLCNMLLEKYRDTTLSISFTTRAPRGSEKDGVEYNFVSRARFEELIQRGELIEWAEVHGNYYGTSKTFLEQQSAAGKVVLLDIDVQGVENLKNAFGGRCLSIFILPPNLEALEKRLRARQTDGEATIRERLKNAVAEMAHAPKFDHRIVNEDLDASFRELCAILEKEVGFAK